MTRDLTLEAQVQQVLNKMWIEKLLPFSLNVGKITKGAEEYTIHFYDSRIPTAKVPLIKGSLLDDSIKSAIRARVAKMSGPLKKPRNKP
jgi:hypothetical protein